MVPSLGQGKEKEERDFESAFKEYKTQFGFLLDTKHIIVDDIKVCCYCSQVTYSIL